MRNKPIIGWPLVSFIFFFLLSVSYYFLTQSVYPIYSKIFILTYGILCFALILVLTIYFLRKNMYRYKVGSRNSWLQAHIYIGIIVFVLALMHVRFKPTGTFSIFLFVIFLLVIISGIIGTLLYSSVPQSLVKFGRRVKQEDEIINNIENLVKEADALVLNTSEELKKIYENKIRPLILLERVKWEYFFMKEEELIEKRKNLIKGFKENVSSHDMHDMKTLSSLLVEIEKHYLMLTRTRILGAWLSLHMPLTLALLTASIIHILLVIYY